MNADATNEQLPGDHADQGSLAPWSSMRELLLLAARFGPRPDVMFPDRFTASPAILEKADLMLKPMDAVESAFSLARCSYGMEPKGDQAGCSLVTDATGTRFLVSVIDWQTKTFEPTKTDFVKKHNRQFGIMRSLPVGMYPRPMVNDIEALVTGKEAVRIVVSPTHIFLLAATEATWIESDAEKAFNERVAPYLETNKNGLELVTNDTLRSLGIRHYTLSRGGTQFLPGDTDAHMKRALRALYTHYPFMALTTALGADQQMTSVVDEGRACAFIARQGMPVGIARALEMLDEYEVSLRQGVTIPGVIEAKETAVLARWYTENGQKDPEARSMYERFFAWVADYCGTDREELERHARRERDAFFDTPDLAFVKEPR